MAKSTKRFNGCGTIYKLSGKRAKPWIARTFLGYEINEDGKTKAKYKTIGTAATKVEAQSLLDVYNASPYNLEANTITFAKLYEMWSNEKFEIISKSNINGYNASFKRFEQLHNCVFKDLKYLDLQSIIDKCDCNYPTLKKMKVLLNQMYTFAMKCEYVTMNYSKFVDVAKYKKRNPNKYEHTTFTNEEMMVLWENSNNKYVQVILMLVYSGLRISTLLDLKKENVFLDEKYIFIEKDKNDVSVRNVPIANIVFPFFESWYMQSPNEYLISTNDGNHMKYRNNRDSYWSPIFSSLGLKEHRPHDTRHTCTTLMEKAKIETLHRMKILGHKPECITDRVYTHIKIEELVEDINQIHSFVSKL